MGEGVIFLRGKCGRLEMLGEEGELRVERKTYEGYAI